MAVCVIWGDDHVADKRCPIECEAGARVGGNCLLLITCWNKKDVRLLQSILKSPNAERIHYNTICKLPQPRKVLRRRPWKRTCFSEWESFIGRQGRFLYRPKSKQVWGIELWSAIGKGVLEHACLSRLVSAAMHYVFEWFWHASWNFFFHQKRWMFHFLHAMFAAKNSWKTRCGSTMQAFFPTPHWAEVHWIPLLRVILYVAIILVCKPKWSRTSIGF